MILAQIRISAFLIALLALAAQPLYAGGGPENVFLVVNPRSWASLTVANHFIQLRQIPAVNVLHLDWSQPADSTDLEGYREKILRPVMEAIQSRRLGDHIDYVVYSSDFPWLVDGRRELQYLKLPDQLTPAGSLTGMTYLGSLVLAHQADFVRLDVNRYVRPILPKSGVPPTHGFRSWYGWGNDGALLEAGGQHYLLSTMLAVTGGRGNSVAEVVSYLQRSAAADGTHPSGSIYYAQNSDVRSTTRQLDVPEALADLEKLHVKAEIYDGQIPKLKQDVQGALVGATQFSWPGALSTILPGAICEHLTSFGGVMSEDASQSPLSEWLRYGAAGSSGAVVEPYAIQAKFPLPQIHVHYARGCSLAEAYYQSVSGPYQLLIVGDPLCRPWAQIPTIEVSGIDPGAIVRGVLMLSTTARVSGGSEVDRFEWYLDGLKLAVSAVGDTVTLDTAKLADGYHELRVVGIETSAIESQGRRIIPFTCDNRGRSVTLSTAAKTVRWGEPLVLSIHAPQALGVGVFQGSRRIGKLLSPQGELKLDPQILGTGPVTLRAVAFGAGTEGKVGSAPVELLVEAGTRIKANHLDPVTVLLPGIDVTIAGHEPVAVEALGGPPWVQATATPPGLDVSLEGYFDALADDIYQVQIRHMGPLVVKIGDTIVYQAASGDMSQMYVPVPLAIGTHKLRAEGKTGAFAQLDLRIGNQGVKSIGRVLQRIVGPFPAVSKPSPDPAAQKGR